MSKYVFHYCERTKAICILLTGKLRLSPFTKLNDPKEVQEWISFVAATKEFKSIKRDTYKVLCLSEGLYPQCGQGSPLDGGWAMGNMWAHYANGSDGICLVFDKNILDLNLKNQFGTDNLLSKPVVYNNDLLTHSNAQSYDPNNKPEIDYLLFHKFNWWSNEKEYRFVVKCNNDQEYLFLKYLDSLKAIIIGQKFPEECREIIYNFSEMDTGIEVYDLKSRNGMPYTSLHCSDKEFQEWRKHRT